MTSNLQKALENASSKNIRGMYPLTASYSVVASDGSPLEERFEPLSYERIFAEPTLIYDEDMCNSWVSIGTPTSHAFMSMEFWRDVQTDGLVLGIDNHGDPTHLYYSIDDIRVSMTLQGIPDAGIHQETIMKSKMMTKVLCRIVIRGNGSTGGDPDKDVVLDGLEFIKGSSLEIYKTNSVTIKNCRFNEGMQFYSDGSPIYLYNNYFGFSKNSLRSPITVDENNYFKSPEN